MGARVAGRQSQAAWDRSHTFFENNLAANAKVALIQRRSELGGVSLIWDVLPKKIWEGERVQERI